MKKKFFPRIEVVRLPGWMLEGMEDCRQALRRSCEQLGKKERNDSFFKGCFSGVGTTYGEWLDLCQKAAEIQDPLALKAFIEEHFQALVIEDEGLFTGYFEPQLYGARVPSERYHVPLYRRPDDLIIQEDLPQERGRRRIGRFLPGTTTLAPYWSRSEIDTGVLSRKKLELLWVDNAIDAFFLHIQGSGRVLLENNEVVSVGYDGTNGQSYIPIGRELVKRGELALADVSMQSIYAWLWENPKEATRMMSLNPSYVFFKELSGDGPIGSQGAPLTPERSLAVDAQHISLGSLLWLDAKMPNKDLYQRLMVAQDTGGAIKGLVRGDIFWGYGPKAAECAGHMKSYGHYFLLVPRKL